MKNSIYLWRGLMTCALALFIFGVHAQIPQGYYTTAEGKSGEELKSALYNIIKGHVEFPYTSSSTDVWDILKETDRDPNNPDNVIGIYSEFSMNAALEYNSGQGWNREHVWAKSRGDFGTTLGAGTDVHHLRAADISTNSARNNRTFAECNTQYIDGSGTYQGPTESFTSTTEFVWKPRAAVKGDIARMIFYMATRYEGYNGELDLEIVDYILDASDKSPIHGRLSELLAWHNEDPVDQLEIQRNDIIYSYQQNRNPYIDHPEYVESIWGSTTTDPVALSFTSTPTTTSVAAELYNYNITTTGGEAALTITATQKPLWLNFTDNTDGTAVLSGIPAETDAGDHLINIEVNDGVSTATQSFTLNVTSGSSGGGNTAELFISEYIEGSSYNKAIEIANFTGSDVDLAGYTLHKQTNGSGSWSSGLALTGILAHGDVFVVAHSSASADILAQSDITTGVSEMTFNGNDALALFKGGNLLDILGVFNDATTFAQDVTKVRNSSVTGPISTYNSAEWDNYASDTFVYLGAHTVDAAAPNELPSASISSPADNTIFTEGAVISISAEATDIDGSISKVVFYEGTNILAEDISAPYSYDWNNAAIGTYSLTAVAYDDQNASATSAAVNISVESAPAELFISEYIEGSSYNKAIEIANLTGADVDLTGYTIHKQTNGSGSWSSGLALTGVLAHGDVFVVTHSSAAADILALADIATGVSEMTFNGNDAIALFKGGNLLDILGVFNDATTFAEDVTKVRNSSVTAPSSTYNSAEWDNYASDTFTYLGAHNKEIVTPVNESPTVSISSPVNNTVFTEGEIITIGADATDSDGTVSKVVFYQGTVILGEDISSPYSFDWANVAAGNYVLTAVAYDDQNASATSPAVNVIVEAQVNEAEMISSINLSSTSKGKNYEGEASISITSNGSNLADAYVEITWRNSNGSYVERQSAYTTSSGAYFISSKLRNNDFTITIDQVIKSGYIWNKTNSELSKSTFNTTNSLKTSLTISADLSDKMNFYPNPFRNTAKIKINALTASNVSINIFNMKGEKLESNLYSVEEGVYEFNVGENLESGIYTVQLISGSRLETYRVIKN